MREYYSLQEYEKDIETLASIIDEFFTNVHYAKPHKAVYGVPQGGCIIARDLSKLLNIQLIDNLNFSGDPDSVLVVDDIMDSGKTRMEYQGYDFACWKRIK